ncbi:HopJ type III effector protein [Winogradskyella sp. Asnod2-B02-A]|uniref:HopJ type III effector protein n=1 Tax=Winogradskyella sp. Asnod2-B02-A TaxID=3160583 RepID=UPI0038650A7B
MSLDDFLIKLKTKPKEIDFSETISVIENYYNFIPTSFTNGILKNDKGENSGSCKLFAFAIEQKLTKEETLACFGSYYFNEVLIDAVGNGHQNIRNFIKTGFEGLEFIEFPLIKK